MQRIEFEFVIFEPIRNFAHQIVFAVIEMVAGAKNLHAIESGALNIGEHRRRELVLECREMLKGFAASCGPSV